MRLRKKVRGREKEERILRLREKVIGKEEET